MSRTFQIYKRQDSAPEIFRANSKVGAIAKFKQKHGKRVRPYHVVETG